MIQGMLLSRRDDIAGPTEVKLLNCFFVLYRTVLLVDETNSLFVQQRDRFVSILSDIVVKHGEATIKRVADRYFVNGKLALFDDSRLTEAVSVVDDWEALRIGGVTFHGEVSQDDVSALFRMLADLKPRAENVDVLTQWLKDNHVPNISLLRLPDEDEDESEIERRQRLRKVARSTYNRTLKAVESAISRIVNDQGMDRYQTRRAVNGIINYLLEDEQSLTELTAIKDFDDYTCAHSVNVCIYALTMGVHLGLDRSLLAQLGQAALFHDIGKARLDQELIRKPGRFTESEWVSMKRHPLLGAKTILQNLKFGPIAVRTARAAFEHHLTMDQTSYPRLKLNQREANLFSKIITVVDAYDALTSGRTYMPEALMPVNAITRMIERIGVQFEPLLLKLFASIIGAWPAGSLVFLRSEELALVVAANNTDPACPVVKIVGDRSGLHDQPKIVDLSLDGEAGRRVSHPADPQKLGLSPSKFILED